ncbi:MAG TPA: ATP-dependent RNA helicase HrpA [Gammaproteobacteria bacterium]|nr:ATP-dependent RNA helicase HrpA [Gammaproteobacteria bacterium]
MGVEAGERRAIGRIEFPPELPVSAERERIAAAILAHPVVVVCGATGSGKTTQLPKICLELGLGQRGLIGHTQPRRIAARAVAARITAELGPGGDALVGWKVRFSDRTGPDCRVKLMTDGILLAELRSDPLLRRYDALIIDEAHERSLNIDFLLGYLKRLLPRRPDLKVVITSATIEPRRFAEYFGGAPVIEVGGTMHPVEVRYRPPANPEDGRIADGVLVAVDELTGPGMPRDGDILVFLPGEREIRETAEALRKHHPPGIEVLPLYGRMSHAEQDRVFRREGRRRVVLATNVAETSLTVPGVRYVIDSGLARISRYSYRSKIQRLQVEAISRASAWQRRGRCGREAAGICIRLYEESDHDARPEYTDPEIRRTNLASVILQMETLGLGAIDEFAFLDPPDGRFVNDGYRLLRELGAVDEDHKVTDVGRRLARLPVDPRVARMLLAAGQSGCLREVLVIAAGLSIRDPRERPADAAGSADERHAAFRDPRSDFLTLCRLWDTWQDQRKHASGSAQRRWCRDNYLSFLRLREWQDVHRQLVSIAHEMGLRESGTLADYAALHRSILAGLLSHIGRLDEQGEYRGPRNVRFRLFPDSTLAARPPRWVVAAELVETGRVWGRTAAAVEPGWIESAGAHLVRRSWSDPHWQPARGFVAAREQVSLYGLVLAADRRVDYARVDPAGARQIFLRDALASGEIRTRGDFLEANRQLVNEVQALEAKLRRRELFAGEDAVAAFYAARVPPEVSSAAAFERWRRKAEKAEPGILRMSPEDLLTGAPLPGKDDYPDRLAIGGNLLPLRYRFDPGADDDGATIGVPRHLLPLLDEQLLDWLVPGWLEEKIVAMLRALPKVARRRIVPVPDHARACLALLRPGHGHVRAALAEALRRTAGLEVEPETWARLELEPWLRFRVELLGDDGRPLAASRDLPSLKQEFSAGDRPIAGSASIEWRGEGFRAWQFGPVPERVELRQGGVRQVLFPAVQDDGASVSCRLFPTPEAAVRAGHLGLLRLFMLALPQQQRALLQHARAARALVLRGRGLAAGSDLAEDAVAAAFAAVFLPGDAEPPRDEADFRARLDAGRARIVPEAENFIASVATLLELRDDCSRRLAQGLTGPGAPSAESDLRAQLSALVYPGFLSRTPVQRLAAMPRYLRGMLQRMERLALAKGEARQALDLAPHRQRLDSGGQETWSSAAAATAFEDYRWMVEEYRVQLFAQQLRAGGKVSHARLEAQWQKVRELQAGMRGRN